MKPVSRDEIQDYVTYSEQRESRRSEVAKTKKHRRIHVGDHLTFLFENHDTTLYQIQEMMRVEQIVKEQDILHEIDTYNELLGGEGELGCTLLIEIETEAERAVKLRQWLDLPAHLYAKLADGTKVRAKFDERQVGDDRLSSVQYLKFDVTGQTPTALGSDLPALTLETALNQHQRQALTLDLADTEG